MRIDSQPQTVPLQTLGRPEYAGTGKPSHIDFAGTPVTVFHL